MRLASTYEPRRRRCKEFVASTNRGTYIDAMTVLAVIALFVVLFMVFISTVLLVIGPVMLLQPHRRTIEFYRQVTTDPPSVRHRAGA